jgi:hypothetical protein
MTTYQSQSCTSTEVEDGPWWQVDLGKPTSISKIRLAGTSEIVADVVPLSDFDVLVDDKPCAVGIALDEDAAKTGDVACDAFGSVVKVMLPREAKLSICEFAVFSRDGPSSEPYDYVGCYTGNVMTRVGSVPATSNGIADCRVNCFAVGYEYFGL